MQTQCQPLKFLNTKRGNPCPFGTADGFNFQPRHSQQAAHRVCWHECLSHSDPWQSWENSNGEIRRPWRALTFLLQTLRGSSSLSYHKFEISIWTKPVHPLSPTYFAVYPHIVFLFGLLLVHSEASLLHLTKRWLLTWCSGIQPCGKTNRMNHMNSVKGDVNCPCSKLCFWQSWWQEASSRLAWLTENPQHCCVLKPGPLPVKHWKEAKLKRKGVSEMPQEPPRKRHRKRTIDIHRPWCPQCTLRLWHQACPSSSRRSTSHSWWLPEADTRTRWQTYLFKKHSRQ